MTVTEAERAEIIEACEDMVQRFAHRSRKHLFPETRHVLETSIDPAQHAEELRRLLRVGVYQINMVECAICGTTPSSERAHEQTQCFCGATYVDGGSLDLRRGGNLGYREMSKVWPWLTEGDIKNG